MSEEETWYDGRLVAQCPHCGEKIYMTCIPMVQVGLMEFPVNDVSCCGKRIRMNIIMYKEPSG